MHTQDSRFRLWFAALVLALCFAAPAFSADGSKLDGLYVNSNGQNSVEFRGDKAFITMVGMASDGIPYDVKGTTITVHAGGMAGDLVLTRNGDGTLEGPLGILRKKPD